MKLLLLALVTGCAVPRMLPGPPALGAPERAAFDAAVPAAVRYTGPPRVEAPVLPLQAWGLRYALDIVLVSDHPDWTMHEYARLDLPDGPVWLAKDADAGGNQGIVADLPDIGAWVPEIPVPRISGPLAVTDRSTADRLDLRFQYTNRAGEPVDVQYAGAAPTEPSHPRNGNTMGHSRAAVAALLDLHLFRAGGDARVEIGGVPRRIARLLGVYPLAFALAQTQAGFAIADYRVAGGGTAFTLTRPGSDAAWPTHATESWRVEGDVVATDGPVTSTRYTLLDGGLVAAEVRQAGVDTPVLSARFQPALPDLRRPFEGVAESRFVVDVAGQPANGIGRIRATSTPDGAIVEFIPEKPRWFADRPMRSTVRLEPGGYTVRIARIDAPAG